MSTTSEVDDYIRSLVKCARALPQKEWRWGQFTRPDGSPIETVEHVCEAQNDSANKSGGTELWGVDLGVDEPVVCYTGNGPRSKDHAQYIAAARPEILMWILAELGERIERLTQERDTASAAAARLSELERENAALQKERDYAVKWGNAAVESVQEAMWRYQDALRAVFARLDHPGNADQRVQYFLRWPEVKAARAALAGSGEP